MYDMPATSLIYPAIWYQGRDRYGVPLGDGYGFSPTGRRLKPCKVKIPGVKFGDTPVRVNCPSCKHDIVTVAIEEDGDCTLSLLSIAMVFLCFIPCLFMSRCKDMVHYCPECKREIGRFNRDRFRPFKPTPSTNSAASTFVPEISYSGKSKDSTDDDKAKDA
ncbi:hypothetical protein EB796_017795 [Bugula neritina]|uniref:LITAF domain-containing protein n=1 Tax=Bugula neritina TaxID=10212 RepID=A0A7J7JEU3_BUGNE|nr:hypothetical protein EB796_017795 [Bugula neritina]